MASDAAALVAEGSLTKITFISFSRVKPRYSRLSELGAGNPVNYFEQL